MATFRKPYDGKRYRVSKEITGESMTKQSFKDQCDINKIIGRFQKTGLVDHVSRFQGNYADLTDVPTYQDAMNKIIAANECFSSLPSNIRKQFSNNPQEFLAFVADPENLPAMAEMGLVTLPEPAPAPPADVPADAPQATPADGGE